MFSISAMRLDSIGESASDVAVGYWWHQDFWISGHAPEHVAIELDVLEIIAKAGPAAQLSAAEIASHITTKNAAAPIMLDRILRLLASYSILTCAHRTLHNGQLERLYGLAPVCKFLVRNEDGVSMAPQLSIDKLTTTNNIYFPGVCGISAMRLDSIGESASDVAVGDWWHQDFWISGHAL
ncbi:hypothetical protein ACLOJK_032097 [Asimina triloba]